ncbi:GNAT family N-acetyltransferase [Anaeromicropila populeti]|uniref:Predicted N-acetyltransferase YhbS n=1 Tax=Anaeromicropila populeti TaxID=37658 RepID=A0A1I6HYK8_9FIRM|nr:N-acetyltransferase [Anaeromicropila populeti]SFR59531.1 Predicted N-acetyltransferase YhbS [Anaeromicropila populeti]
MQVSIREERIEDWYDTEYVTKKAFWNLHFPGCSEHYLVHKLRQDSAYLPEFTRVAEVDGVIVGAIWYSKAHVHTEKEKIEIVTFGPLCVEPAFQKKGIGGMLLRETMELVKKAGYKAIIIFGEPDYYPRHGFITCDHFGITTKDGKNFDAFMGIELEKGALAHAKGKFTESEVFENLPPEEVDQYDKKFPYMEKLKLPGQWS